MSADIAAVHINLEGEELTFKKAARQLRVFADMIDAGMMSADGFNWNTGGEYNMVVVLPSAYPHGDYQDREGNLVHVGASDHIISVVWANKDAETEDLSEQDVHVYDWIKEHGPLRPAGAGEAPEGHDHGHEGHEH